MDQKFASSSKQDSDQTFDEIFGFKKPNCNERQLKSSQSSIRRPYSFSLNKKQVRINFNPEKNEKYLEDSSLNKSMMSGFDIYSSDQKIQEPRKSKSKESKVNGMFGKISPPQNRFSRRREIFQVEDYSKYMEELDNQAEHMAKIDQSSRKINHEGPEKNYEFQVSQQKSEVKKPNFGVNKSRKRAPTIDKVEEKPVFLRPIGVTLGAKQKVPKLKTQEIQQKRQENNFNNPPLKSNIPQTKDPINQNNNKKAIICFHCGGPHYANKCTSQLRDNLSQNQRKCFNCKKQGHTAKYCPEKWCCTKCNSTQHFAKDCLSTSSLIIEQKICSNCLQQGHYTRQCAEKKRCFQCQQQGHQRKDCPKNKQNLTFKKEQQTSITIECYNCKKTGHYANQCSKPLTCHRCGLTGHYARDCPHITGSLSFYNPVKSSNFLQNNQDQNFWKKSMSSYLPNTQKTKIELKGIPEKQNIQPNNDKVYKKKRISRPDGRKQEKDIQI